MIVNPRWRPQCYVCSRFVAMEAQDCFYDYYTGAWEEGYTACPEHGGPSREKVLEIRAERAAKEGRWLAHAARSNKAELDYAEKLA